MYQLLQAILNGDEKAALEQLILSLNTADKRYFLRNEILQAFANYCHKSQKPTYFYHSSSVGKLIHYTHEMILLEGSVWLVVRPHIASQQVWRLTADLTEFELMTPQALLDVRDRLVNRYQTQILEIDLGPFYKACPKISDHRNIGQGLAFLNRYFCSQVLSDPQYWLEVLFQALQGLQFDSIPLLLNSRIHSGTQLAEQLQQAIKFLSQQPSDEPYLQFRSHLQELGLEAGWGDTASRVCETLELLERLGADPQPTLLEAFVSRIPVIFRVVLISIHGRVTQEDILGRDKTLDQVIYVLEQARSLENKLRAEIRLAGLDCLGIRPHVIILTRLISETEVHLEKVHNTENAWILRVPFADPHPDVIWPYLEKYALDAETELLAKFPGKPNLIIGNYSDGNLVAFLLSRRLKAIQCHIAHSLEKPKYLFSDLYWQDLEDQYHFSAQFTADLISMNAADFIITSSYQEIVGTPDTVGQYESYKCFTMPQLYHVVDGIDLFHPKFNMVPPGVDEEIFFPYNQKGDREPKFSQQIHELLFFQEDQQIIGYLDQPQKQPIFTVSPIHSIDNLTGLAECFGNSRILKERCNLILLTSKVHSSQASNPEESVEIQRLHDIINQYNLHGHIRWLGIPLTNRDLGEAYRVISDYRGIYVHFARFQSFGRTILEAMISGLPTFATQFGGTPEIIEERENGFYLNPTDLEGAAQKISEFLQKCDTHPEHWQEISVLMSQRVRHKYNWDFHVNQLLLLAKVFSFWNFVAPENHEARDLYMETLFYLVYKPRAGRF